MVLDYSLYSPFLDILVPAAQFRSVVGSGYLGDTLVDVTFRLLCFLFLFNKVIDGGKEMGSG